MSITISSFSPAVSKCLYPRYSLVTKCPKCRKISVKFEAKTSHILELRLSQNLGGLLWLSQFQACASPREFVILSVPAVGNLSSNLCPGVGHLPILLEAVSIVLFSIFHFKICLF